MTQIQDDAINRSGATSSDAASSNISNTSANGDNIDSTGSNNTDNTTEIDRLLAELDRLAKETETQSSGSAAVEKPTTEEPATAEAAAKEETAESTEQSLLAEPDRVDQVSSTSVTAQSASSNEDTKATDKFDFDSFLADLEKKIDTENEQKAAAEAESGLESKTDVQGSVADTQEEAEDAQRGVGDVQESLEERAPEEESPEEGALEERAPEEESPESVGEEFVDDFRKNRAASNVQPEETEPEEKQPEEQSEEQESEENAEEERLKNNKLADSAVDSAADSTADSADKQVDKDTLNQEDGGDEALKAQNIFEMLGLTSIADSEKDQFLDELETVIWDDFVMHDLELVLTSEEYAGALKILDAEDQKNNEKKENLIVYLEKILPNLDEILYDKALELKSEMMAERLSQMKKNADEATLAKIKEVENLISQNKWKSASLLLNQLG
ncbi:MAG TPA: hypothetical protein PLQ50_00150 [Candidatus Woesebacteria bacterium]|nr:hypothetical protein [Candidatus Woesebacteria bacterium]